MDDPPKIYERICTQKQTHIGAHILTHTHNPLFLTVRASVKIFE